MSCPDALSPASVNIDRPLSGLVDCDDFPKLAILMFVIGLTGGIGTGKTQVSDILASLGATIINADQVGHEAYLPNTRTWHEVVAAFGRGVLSESGEIDRGKLGGVVFSDPDALKRLNSITHPRIFEMIRERIDSLGGDGAGLVVVEAALLIEANWTPLVDQVWVVTSEESDVVARLVSRNNLSEDSIRARIASQMPQAERVTHAHVIINNDGGLSQLRSRVQKAWQEGAQARN